MTTISNGESGLSVRNKINEAINKVDGVTPFGNNIDVTGTVTADGLTVDGAASIGSSTAKTKFYSDSTYSGMFNGASLGSNESFYMGAGALFFYGGGSEHMRIDASGNLLLAGTGTPTSSAGNLVIYNGTAPTGSATNGVILYAEDVSASSELKVRDEAGNVTTLSPHNFDLIPEGPSEDMAWSYYSERDGKRINVDMLKAIRILEQLSGEKLVHMV